MSHKSKYRFDPDLLSYDKVELNAKKKFLLNLIAQLISALVIAGALFLAISYFYESPSQKKIKRENKKLKEQYNLLNDRLQQTEKVMDDLKKRDNDIYRAIFEAEPPAEDLIQNPYEKFEGANFMSLMEESSVKLVNMKILLKNEKNLYQDLIQILKDKSTELSRIPSIQPLPNSDLQFVPYGFGNRIDPVYKTPSYHYGIDFAAPKGTEVFATADGVVIQADERVRGLGLHIRIKHNNEYQTVYAHLSEVKVSVGKNVKRGDVIGLVGSTGKSLVSHLHYEVHQKGKPVNPVNFFFQELTPEQYARMIVIVSRGGLSLD